MLSTRIRLGALGLSLALAPAFGAWPGPASAQADMSAEDLVLKLQLCRSLKNRAFRLNCFDGLAHDLPRQLENLPLAGPGITAARPSSEQPVPLPPSRPEARFDLAASELPEMVEAGRKTAVAVAGPNGADWSIAPAPPIRVAQSPDRDIYQLVESTELTTDGAGGSAGASQGEAPPPVETAANSQTSGPDQPSGDIAALFEIATTAEAATSPGSVPLPPEPPARPDLAGLLDDDIPLETPPQSEATEAAVEAALAEEPIETASLGDTPVTPTIKRNWSVSGWTSPLSGVSDMTLTRASERLDDGPVTLLSFSCTNESGAVQIVWPRGMSADTVRAELVIDGAAGEAEDWALSPDGRTMSREGRAEALSMARRIAKAGRVTVRIADDPAHEWRADFGTDGLQSHLQEFGSACSS